VGGRGEEAADGDSFPKLMSSVNCIMD